MSMIVKPDEFRQAKPHTAEALGKSDPFGPNGGEAAIEKPLRPMPSWIDYGKRNIDRSQYHVGEGFLEIGVLSC